ncbi:MAG: hypothetical protein CV045_10420 [Cyanobacteria bacterium M5B4]|nr:DUF565 domain-containing protein [Cyanobacteria bacterium KgW148]PLS67997.1 MAG: hypothetical protein CV045_10420 [Cyanobacteria bacterium M5B4]
MQNTRLNNIAGLVVSQIEQWLQNPWRALLLHILGFLIGFFLGIAIATYTGQQAVWDLPAVGLTVLTIELISWYFYRPGKRSPIGGILHTTKLGLTYNLILEAFKLGS